MTVRSILGILAVSVLWSGCGRPTPPVEEVSVSEYEELAPPTAAPDDWPWWRGPQHNGIVPASEAPVEWGPDTNVAWKQDVPGDGHSSPCVCGDRVFLTTSDEKQQTQSLLAFDRSSGKKLWEKVLHTGKFMAMHPKNSHASPTPACDGERVFAAFINSDALQLSATDLDGNVLWHTNAGAFRSQHGYGSSPVLYESMVIVNGDNPGSAFIAAFHRKTGKVVWKVARPNRGSYATPIIANVAGRDQLLQTGGQKVTSYDPKTGDVLWTCDGPSDTTANTVAFDSSHVYVSGGYPQKEILCIAADGSGDVTSSHVRWTSSKGVSYVPSPLITGERIFFASDNGVANCLDTKTGESVWRSRLDGDVSSSFVQAGSNLYITNEKGTTFVFDTTEQPKLLAKNSLDERVMATPAIAGNQLFLRTEKHLYCFSN